jgi:hypothetical protein
MPYYHASPHALAPGDKIEVGHPANFNSVPMAWVYCADNMESAEFWADFLGGESQAEKLGYWPEITIYEVEPTGYLEPDPWCVYYDVKGCWQSKAPLIVKEAICK